MNLSIARGALRTTPSFFDTGVYMLVALLVVMAVFGPMVAPDSVYVSDIRNALMPPSAAHWFGTDDQGRDVMWRVIAGARATLLSAMLIVTAYSLIGVLIATLAAVGPRWLDETLMRITDIGLALPGLVVALGFAAALGPSLQSAIIAKAITGWPVTARLLRAILRQTMTAQFVVGAQAMGVSRWRLMTRHVLPNSLDILVVKWAGDIGGAVLVLAGMSFIGVGAQPPSAEWGAMIANAKGYVANAWWVVAAPGVAIVLAAVGFGLLGDILQVRRDPGLRGRE
ncbi:ABC transporter permease [Paraburkholderia susongensis]|uniref:Peptide/nickel transport system permease protein n=1 Tax=Paraburkholderia susongensis TaxID=1515439 RepID=A0A1X7LWM5_9BURK|nr:ABC transporter permease [Paraburkholderia susongensis]SMG58110.1 peptide/nickel transport system permease protein [Paraburkholderia susongensis]